MYNLTGLSITDTSGLIMTHAQMGGLGTVANKALAIPCHIGHPWASVEYVFLPPGDNSVGEHTQTTDEIYLIVEGIGALMSNGITEFVNAGTLVVAPRGTRHSIANISTKEPLSFLVVEVATEETGRRAWTMNLRKQLYPMPEYAHPVWQGTRQIVPTAAERDLQQDFGGSWGTLSLLELPPGSRVASYIEPIYDQLFFVMRGQATFFIAKGPEEEIRIESSDGSCHQSVLVPRGVPRRYSNQASGASYPLLLACLNIRRGREQREEACVHLEQEVCVSRTLSLKV